jgi:hypothetical protein
MEILAGRAGAAARRKGRAVMNNEIKDKIEQLQDDLTLVALYSLKDNPEPSKPNEIARISGLGETITRQALSRLREKGMCSREGDIRPS